MSMEVNLNFHGETDKAIKVSEGVKDSEGKLKFIWLPKSQIEYEERKDGTVDVTLPDWLYEKSELSS